MLATKNEYLKIAYDELEKISADKQKRLEYEACQKALYDYNTLIDEAEERGIEKGVGIYIRRLKKMNVSTDNIIKTVYEDFGINVDKSYIEGL